MAGKVSSKEKFAAFKDDEIFPKLPITVVG